MASGRRLSRRSAAAGGPAELGRLTAMAELLDDEGALDDDVHDLASAAGSNINNQGVTAQVRYLIEQVGPAAAEDMITAAARCGEEP